MFHNDQDEHKKCPCGSGKPFAFCCEPCITGRKRATTAEALMRSRYTAFSMGMVDYLIDTTAPEKRTADDAEVLAQQVKYTNWTKLEVLDKKAGTLSDNAGQVEFCAYFEADDEQGVLHEVSNFRKESDHWFYVDGQVEVRCE